MILQLAILQGREQRVHIATTVQDQASTTRGRNWIHTKPSDLISRELQCLRRGTRTLD